LVAFLTVDSVSACRILRRCCCCQLPCVRIFRRPVCRVPCPPSTCRLEVSSSCPEVACDLGVSDEFAPSPADALPRVPSVELEESADLPTISVPDPSPLDQPSPIDVLPIPEMPATFPPSQDALPAPLPEVTPQNTIQDAPQLPVASPEPTQPVDTSAMPEETEETTDEPSEAAPVEEPETHSLDDLLESTKPTEPVEPSEPDSSPEEAASEAISSEQEQQEPTEEPTEEAPKEEKEKKELSFEDLFSSQKQVPVLGEPGGLASEQLRLWSDNTGRFGCQARLLRVTTQEVVLQKASGKEKQVALSRLSSADLQFVHRQVIAQRRQLESHHVIEMLATAWAD